MKFKIVQADKNDAPLIARTIAVALHMDQPHGTIEVDDEEMQLWNRIFTVLATREDSQYSYLNTLKAIDQEGKVLGMIINYDGARLHHLREAFFEEVEKITGKKFGKIYDETSPEEWYLDSLAVWPEYRGNGIGTALLEAAIQNAHSVGKPAGLLVDKSNIKERKLYESLGFRVVGETPFAGTIMDHMKLNK